MPAGFRVFNDAFTLQVDQDYANLGLSSKGSLSMVLDTAPHPQAMRIGSVTITGGSPIIAFSAPEETGLWSVTNSGTSWTFYFRSRSDVNFTLNYWVFDNANYSESVPDTFGIMVFNAAGSLIYHSGQKVVRVVDLVSLTPPSGISGAGGGYSTSDRTYAAGRAYAVVQSSFCYFEQNMDSPFDYGPLSPGQKWMDYEAYQSVAAVSGASVHVGTGQFEAYSNAYPVTQSEIAHTYGDLHFWVLDVTNY